MQSQPSNHMAHVISHISHLYVRIYIIYVVCNAFGCRLCIWLPGCSTSFHDLQHNRWVVSFVSHPLGTTGEHGYDSASTWEWSQWGTVLVSNDQLEEVELTRKDVCIVLFWQVLIQAGSVT